MGGTHVEKIHRASASSQQESGNGRVDTAGQQAKDMTGSADREPADALEPIRVQERRIGIDIDVKRAIRSLEIHTLPFTSQSDHVAEPTLHFERATGKLLVHPARPDREAPLRRELLSRQPEG